MSRDRDLILALRSRRITVITPLDAGLVGKPDHEQLAFSAEQGLVLYTCNISDFCRLHAEWVAAGREHSGIILVQQQRYSIGEQLRRILRLSASNTAASMTNRAEFLSGWG